MNVVPEIIRDHPEWEYLTIPGAKPPPASTHLERARQRTEGTEASPAWLAGTATDDTDGEAA